MQYSSLVYECVLLRPVLERAVDFNELLRKQFYGAFRKKKNK